jgi:hypothetical protein
MVLAASACSAPTRKVPGATTGDRLPTDQVLTGTFTRPALTVEGLPVKAVGPGWTADITVSGPTVPGEGLPYQAPSTTCTWTVTISHATASIPLSLTDFNSIDHLGHIYAMAAVPSGPTVPTRVGPGQTVTFQIRAYELVGEGVMRWAPDRQHIVGEWDFEVEND